MDDDDGFIDYVQTSVDPGYYLLVATGVFCLMSNLMLPCFVALGRRYQKRHGGDLNETLQQDDDEEEEHEKQAEEESKQSSTQGQEVVLDERMSRLNSHNGSENPSKAGSRTGSRVSESSGIAPYLSQGVLASLTRNSSNTAEQQETPAALSAPSVASSHYSRTTSNVSFVSAVTSTVLDGGFISPFPGGRGRRRRAGAEGRRRRLHQEYMESIRNLQNPSNPNNINITNTAVETASPVSQNGSSSNKPTKPSLYSSPTRSELSFKSCHSRKSSRVSSRRGWSIHEDDINPEDAPDAHDIGTRLLPKGGEEDGTLAFEDVDLCCGDNAWWKPKMMSQGWLDLLDIADWNAESKRLVQLAVPFSLAAVVEGALELVALALIAQYIGTSAVAAFTIVNLCVGISGEFVGGVVETITVLCPHAIGGRNYLLAGQYVQISALLNVIASVPFIVLWYLAMDNVMIWFGFDGDTAQMAQEFANVLVFADLVSGVHEVYLNFLSVIDRERWATIVSIVEETLALVVILINVLARDNTTLQEIGLFYLFVGVFVTCVNLILTIKWGWVQKYLKGMVGTFALKNRPAVITMLATSAPLCVGALMAYGEWEILTIFAAKIGPAEVATWGILGTLWETVESTSEGFADAGEIRCAYQLGAGRPLRAKKAAYKAIVIGFYASSVFTSIIFILGENLAYWFTSDPTLQRMIVELLPLMGIGNITLTAGSVSWALVGAQGRYRLATIVSVITSWGVTLPLAALLTYGFNINLQGLTASVVVGYSLTGTVLSCILILSDWPGLSREIVAQHAAEEAAHGDASSSCSSSSKSSSSSSSNSAILEN